MYIPEAVYHEVVVEGGERPGAIEVKKADWIKIVHIKNKRLANYLRQEIDVGEAEAIVLALELRADVILLDDADARMIARSMRLNVKGTIGVLLLAWRKGLLEDVEEKIKELMSKGYRLRSDIYLKIIEEIRKRKKSEKK